MAPRRSRFRGAGQFVAGLGLVRQAELFDPAIKTRAGNSQHIGGSRLVAPSLAQCRFDQPTLDLNEDLIERLDGAWRRRRNEARAQIAANRRRQVISLDDESLTFGAGMSVVDDASQLTKVSRPV